MLFVGKTCKLLSYVRQQWWQHIKLTMTSTIGIDIGLAPPKCHKGKIFVVKKEK
jgi:hypothetical protein